MRLFRKMAALVGAVCLVVGALAAPAAAASNSVIYNNVPSPQPGNLPSQAFEATSTSEFGGQVKFAGTARYNPKVTVLMSSWGCENGSWFAGTCTTTPGTSFTEPITLNVYNVGGGNAVGSLVKQTTKTFTIPFRPSADVTHCTGGKWYDGTTCFNGLVTPITFDLTGVTLPDTAIVTLAYNTSHYGYTPIGQATPCFSTTAGCGYDSLNVALVAPPTVGTATLPNDAYINSKWGGAYCDNGAGGTGALRLDAGCWTGYQPAIKVEASTPSKADCKKNGWKAFTNPSFGSQGACEKWFDAKAEGQLQMGNPSQRIKFYVSNVTKTGHDRDDDRKNTVEYWNYDYPGGLHYSAAVTCVNANPATKEVRFMFQIPDGHPGLSGLYVVAYAKEVKKGADLYGHAATADLATATAWCRTGVGFTPTMYPVTHGKVDVE